MEAHSGIEEVEWSHRMKAEKAENRSIRTEPNESECREEDGMRTGCSAAYAVSLMKQFG